MARYYTIRTATFGDIVKRDDTIKAARAWAKSAFPREHVQVTRLYEIKGCPDCLCQPCCCMVRADV